jgi:hypothetical protein
LDIIGLSRALGIVIFVFSQSLFAVENVIVQRKKLATFSVVSDSKRKSLDSILYSDKNIDIGIQKKIDYPPTYFRYNETLIDHLIVPANSSVQTEKEIEYLLNLQAQRTEKIIAEVRSFAILTETPPKEFKWIKQDIRGPYLFANIFGASFNRQTLPKTRKLINGVIHDIDTICFQVKYKLRRPRPHQLNDSIKSALENATVPNHPAFPSGHSCMGYGSAEIFSILLPKYKNDLFELADRIALSREWAGIHFPSDNEGAKILVKNIMKEMRKNEKFITDLNEATAELKMKYLDKKLNL